MIDRIFVSPLELLETLFVVVKYSVLVLCRND